MRWRMLTYREIISMLDNQINQARISGRMRPLILAIDGRCAAGKTTLAWKLSESFDCSVVHMDHFFLRPRQRSEERLAEAGGNVDYERFQEEVISGLKGGRDFSYRIFDCKEMDFCGRQDVRMKSLLLVEGAYCCRPEFMPLWDMTIFLDIDQEEQLRRIESRNGAEQLRHFQERWIPMEERYFQAFRLQERCTLSGRLEGE